MFVYPNPANEIVNIKYKISNPGIVRISMYNLLGEKIMDIVNKTVLEGKYESGLNLESISPGMYTFKMVLDGKTVIVKRLVVTK